jgi:hypothetical protein
MGGCIFVTDVVLQTTTFLRLSEDPWMVYHNGGDGNKVKMLASREKAGRLCEGGGGPV